MGITLKSKPIKHTISDIRGQVSTVPISRFYGYIRSNQTSQLNNKLRSHLNISRLKHTKNTKSSSNQQKKLNPPIFKPKELYAISKS